MASQSCFAPDRSPYSRRKFWALLAKRSTPATSASLGQISRRNTGLPSFPVPIGSRAMSVSTVPASANATTSGGLIKKFALRLWCTRASKLRLPESTAQAMRSFLTTGSSSPAASGPALPMQVVQP
ncbi:hypothetical protein D3C83_09970 [compost metagenome]